MYRSLLYTVLCCIIFYSCQPNEKSKSVPDKSPTETEVGVIADSAMVVTAHPAASQVGIDIIRQGGNAFDAAIAVQFALAVVYPRAGNIGGGGFAVYRSKDGTSGALDFREKASQASTKDMYLDADGNVIKGLSIKGHLAAGVPGTVDGMVKLHEKYGSLPFSELVQPAVNLAYHGVVSVSYTHLTLPTKRIV